MIDAHLPTLMFNFSLLIVTSKNNFCAAPVLPYQNNKSEFSYGSL